MDKRGQNRTSLYSTPLIFCLFVTDLILYKCFPYGMQNPLMITLGTTTRADNNSEYVIIYSLWKLIENA